MVPNKPNMAKGYLWTAQSMMPPSSMSALTRGGPQGNLPDNPGSLASFRLLGISQACNGILITYPDPLTQNCTSVQMTESPRYRNLLLKATPPDLGMDQTQ